MSSDWRKFVVVLSLLIVVVGALMPDACAEDSATFVSTSAALSTPHTGDQPFGCQHDEDCFCCAHIVPLAVLEIYPFIGVARAEQQHYSPTLEHVPSTPYHPPRA